MRPTHVAAALAVVAIWGGNFVVVDRGVAHFPPLLLAALRMVLVAFPACVPVRPLLLVVAAGASWAVGNVATREAAADRPFALMIWAAAAAPLPLAVLSLIVEGPDRDAAALRHVDAAGLLALVYLVVMASL